MFKITEICSSHYVVGDDKIELCISNYITDLDDFGWVVYFDDMWSEDSMWFKTKNEALVYVENLCS